MTIITIIIALSITSCIDGQMFTCGTSNYLKHKFGVGYNLTIVKQEGANDNSIIHTIQQYIPDASILTNVGAEMTFQLPFTASNQFVALFTELDSRLNELKLNTYGVSVTTMEEVFLNSAKVVDREFAKTISSKREGEGSQRIDGQGISFAEGAKHLQVNQEVTKEKMNRKDFTRTTSDIEENLFWRHFCANFIKRMNYAIRDKKMFVMELLIPAFFTALVFAMVKLVFTMTNVPSYEMDTRYYNDYEENGSLRQRSRVLWDNYGLGSQMGELMAYMPEDRLIPQEVDLSEMRVPEVCSTLYKYLWCHDPVCE